MRMQFDQGLHCHFNHHWEVKIIITQVLDTMLLDFFSFIFLHFSVNAKRIEKENPRTLQNNFSTNISAIWTAC